MKAFLFFFPLAKEHIEHGHALRVHECFMLSVLFQHGWQRACRWAAMLGPFFIRFSLTTFFAYKQVTRTESLSRVCDSAFYVFYAFYVWWVHCDLTVAVRLILWLDQYICMYDIHWQYFGDADIGPVIGSVCAVLLLLLGCCILFYRYCLSQVRYISVSTLYTHMIVCVLHRVARMCSRLICRHQGLSVRWKYSTSRIFSLFFATICSIFM